jgi:hypothetical protein
MTDDDIAYVKANTELYTLSVRFSDELADRLRAFASASERSLAQAVRLLVREGLEREQSPPERETSSR